MRDFDYLLVGGGLQSGLLAAALAQHRPAARVAVVERGAALGGSHTWCFHAADVAPRARSFVEPFIAKRWPGYVVRFPRYGRRLAQPYAAVTVESFRRALERLVDEGRVSLFLDSSARGVERERVVLASSEELRAPVVIDARGPTPQAADPSLGFQKFVGLELALSEDTLESEPTLMDACVPQRDGFRFFYSLPLSRRRVLVEDTYFSDSPELERARLRSGILEHAARSGLRVRGVLRQEEGVLPLPLEPPLPTGDSDGALLAGFRGGWFHPTTGYSFPLAVRFALEVALREPPALRGALEVLARRERRQQRFAALLNRLLFRGFAPEQRFEVLQRFYRLPPPVVQRFYALSLTRVDQARILCGRPPAGFSLFGFLKGRPAPFVAAPPPGVT